MGDLADQHVTRSNDQEGGGEEGSGATSWGREGRVEPTKLAECVPTFTNYARCRPALPKSVYNSNFHVRMCSPEFRSDSEQGGRVKYKGLIGMERDTDRSSAAECMRTHSISKPFAGKSLCLLA